MSESKILKAVDGLTETQKHAIVSVAALIDPYFHLAASTTRDRVKGLDEFTEAKTICLACTVLIAMHQEDVQEQVEATVKAETAKIQAYPPTDGKVGQSGITPAREYLKPKVLAQKTGTNYDN